MTLSADGFDEFFEGIWSELGRQKRAGLIANEADFQATAYSMLRDKLDPEGFRVFNEWRLEEEDERHYKVDLGVADPDGNLWIALEFKGIWKGRYASARRDVLKLKNYLDRSQKGKPGYKVQRGCFCFTSNVAEPERLRAAVYPQADWARGYLRIAEGFETTNEPYTLRKF